MIKDPLQVLNKIYGYSHFRDGQEEVINNLLSGVDTIALMPTGGGKSLCYQIPALCKPGLAIVVSPLIALIKDQVNQLKQRNIKAVGITSGISYSDLDSILDNCIYGNYQFLYLSPERLQQELVQVRIAKMNVNLIAIDEAHCISEWGHDFRPAYLQIKKIKELLPAVPLIAVTATATSRVLEDITTHLELEQSITYRHSFERKNIAYKIVKTTDKRSELVNFFKQNNFSSITYVRSRKNTAEFSQLLNHHGIASKFYHGGLDQKSRDRNALEWKTNSVQVMVATNAFGMGIDKPDVRNIVHLQLPDSIESYYQETGRAGRDGADSLALFLYNPNDIEHATNQFLRSQPTVSGLKKIYKGLNNYLRIALGEGQSTTHNLNFPEFCNRQQLDGMTTFAGLQALERYGIIELQHKSSGRTRVRFRESGTKINQFTIKRPKEHAIIQSILRSYGSSKFQTIEINTELIALRSNTSTHAVNQTLKQLSAYELADVELNHTDLLVTFLVPREDDRTINCFKNEIEQQLNLKKSKLQRMIDFVQEDEKCLNNFLLEYFDEKPMGRCGRCSNCLKSQLENCATTSILDFFEPNLSLSIQELQDRSGKSREELIKQLRRLLEEKVLRSTPDFKYRLL
ncbi:MAG: ATP-dependent DNA helicase RecQ [Nonlabens sp.]